MGATRFKICGLRRAADVDAAVAAGAHALGFIFYPPSPRAVTVDAARALTARVPLWVDKVAVFVATGPAQTLATVDAVGATCIQWHGDLTPELCRALGSRRLVWALPAARPSLARVAAVRPWLSAVLLDASVAGLHGGTGTLADWGAAREVCAALAPLPVILAGGLTAENVGEAIAAVRPFGVDVASGVERAPGVKDPERVRRFGEAVRRAE
jgi:phosphoribosylanthranilate isomerase